MIVGLFMFLVLGGFYYLAISSIDISKISNEQMTAFIENINKAIGSDIIIVTGTLLILVGFVYLVAKKRSFKILRATSVAITLLFMYVFNYTILYSFYISLQSFALDQTLYNILFVFVGLFFVPFEFTLQKTIEYFVLMSSDTLREKLKNVSVG